jgi:hypothetical protein
MILLAAISIIVLADPVTISADRQFLDGFAVIVNGRVILDSEVTFEIALTMLKKDPEIQSVPDRKAVLEKLIDRELLLDEARRFVPGSVTDKELAERIERTDRVFNGMENRVAFCRANGVDETFWRGYVRNQVLLEKYIEQRFRTFVRVTRDQENQYISDHRSELGLEPDADPEEAVPTGHPLRSVIQSLLAEQAVQERIADFLKDLRTSANLSYSIVLREPDPEEKRTENGTKEDI